MPRGEEERLSPDAELVRRLQLGKQIEEWVSGDPVGKDLFDWAVQFAEEGWRQFVKLDPSDPDFVKKCRALHAEAQFPERFMQYVEDRMNQALNAEEQIRHNQDINRPDDYPG